MTNRLIQLALDLAIVASLGAILAACLSSATTHRELIHEIGEVCTIWGL